MRFHQKFNSTQTIYLPCAIQSRTLKISKIDLINSIGNSVRAYQKFTEAYALIWGMLLLYRLVYIFGFEFRSLVSTPKSKETLRGKKIKGREEARGKREGMAFRSALASLDVPWMHLMHASCSFHVFICSLICEYS